MYVPMAVAATLGALGLWIRVLICRRYRVRNPSGPMCWPWVGSILELRANFHRLYDWLTDYATDIPTFEAYIMATRVLFTVDPANVEHILKINFPNYEKGPEVQQIQYDLLGDGIFNSDGEMWRHQRKSASLEFSSKMLRIHSTNAFRKNSVKLARVLQEQMADKDSVAVNMQDMFMRMTFDSICELSFGVEIGSLASSLPDVAFASAFDRCSALCASRSLDPFWKLKKRFNVGSEAEIVQNVRVLDEFTYGLIQNRKSFIEQSTDKEVKSDLMSRFLLMAKENPEIYTDKKLRDAILNFVIAGRDTTAVTLSWLIWLLSKNPQAENKIVKELEDIDYTDNCSIEKFSELLTYDVLANKLHYLHAAITETLRLYPAVPLDAKEAAGDDVLPDGTRILKGNIVNYLPYAMGRMTTLWGIDALKFSPERWLNEDCVFQPQSPFKFTAFQAGPRICLGKDSAYLQMKMAAAVLLRFFCFNLEEGYEVKYRVALTLFMSSLPMTVLSRERSMREKM